jgi:pimeloyl-ACP methyl ester carboxylesterase
VLRAERLEHELLGNEPSRRLEVVGDETHPGIVALLPCVAWPWLARQSWAVARGVLGVLVLLACVLAVGCGGQEPKARRGATPRLAPVAEGPGRFVAIGAGRSLYMECVGSGSPTVVLEAGAGADTHSWQDVQPQVGRGTRTCAYDRAGTGNSVAPPGMRDARDEIADLRRLLARARIEPPYVLVGHSYGAVLARVFAHLYPSETAGLVLIETMGRDGRRRQLAIWPRSQAPELRRGLANSVIDGVDLAAGEAIASRVTSLGGLPLAVITAGREDNFPRRPARLNRALNRLWNGMQDELAALSDNSVHVVALRSSHDIPSGQPSVIVRAVQGVVRAARTHERLPRCRRLFSGQDVRCRG